MSEAVQMIRSALQSEVDAMRTVAENVANLNTPAFKREVQVAQSDYARVSEEPSMHAVAASRAVADLRPGALKSSSEPLHMAISGPGFFVIDVQGVERLTRRGDFRLDEQGRLVTYAGQPVQAEQGAVGVPAGGLLVAPDGTLTAARDGESLGRLRLVEVADAQALVAHGDGTFTLRDAAVAGTSNGSEIRQGFLETSNVDSVGEILKMMEVVRQFEMAQRLARGYDEMQRTAISTLGRV